LRILLTADPTIPVPPAGYGGIERIVDGLARAYGARRHAVGLVAHPESACATDALFGWPRVRERGLADAARNAWALRCAARAFRPDVVHSFSRLGYLLPLLRSPVPKVMSYQRHTGGRQIGWAARLGRGSLRFTGCSRYISAMGQGAGGDWTAIPNFVELEKLPFAAAVPADAPLLFLSRVESIKGPDLAIAIARAAGRRLVIAGNRPEGGPERAFWSRAVEPCLGRDGIEWVGEVNDVQKAALLGQAAALLVPIQWDEPFGIVFAEALAAGTPVLTCARGATPEIVDDGVTGFFVTNATDGAAAVGRLDQIDRRRCRAVAQARFSRDTCAEQYLELYRRAAP